jgi:hypothetical protein
MSSKANRSLLSFPSLLPNRQRYLKDNKYNNSFFGWSFFMEIALLYINRERERKQQEKRRTTHRMKSPKEFWK